MEWTVMSRRGEEWVAKDDIKIVFLEKREDGVYLPEGSSREARDEKPARTKSSTEEMDEIKEAVMAFRKMKADLGISSKAKPAALCHSHTIAHAKAMIENADTICHMAGLSAITIVI